MRHGGEIDAQPDQDVHIFHKNSLRFMGTFVILNQSEKRPE